MKPIIYKEIVTPKRRKEIYELGISNKFSTPNIYILKPNCNTLTIHGKDDISKYLNVEKIPSSYKTIRINSSVNSGVIFSDKNTILVRIFSNIQDIITIKKTFDKVIKEKFLNKNVTIDKSSHNPYSNDYTFIKDGNEKKFCGVVTDLLQSYFSFFITLDFDKSKIEGLYKMDTTKMKNRGDISDISDIVGGIREANPNIDDSIVDDIINGISKELNWI